MRITNVNPECWYDIPGYEGSYQINWWGNIRTMLKNKKYKIMKTQLRSDGKHIIRLYKDGKYKEWTIMRLMRITFIGELPAGYVTYHKDEIKNNEELSNIGIISRSELTRKTNAKSKRSIKVVKINSDGEIVDCYKSIRNAAKKNNLSYGTLVYYVSKKARYLYAPDGYVYCKDNGAEIAMLVRKIEKDKNSGVRI